MARKPWRRRRSSTVGGQPAGQATSPAWGGTWGQRRRRLGLARAQARGGGWRRDGRWRKTLARRLGRRQRRASMASVGDGVKRRRLRRAMQGEEREPRARGEAAAAETRP